MARIERAGLWAAVVSTVISAVALGYTGLAYRDQLETNAQQERAIALQQAALISQQQSTLIQVQLLQAQVRIAQQQLIKEQQKSTGASTR